MNSQDVLQNLTTKLDGIIEGIDAASANKLLKQISQMSPVELAGFGNQLEDIKLKLKIVNFPNLNDEEAADIIKNHLLSFFQIDIPLEQRIVARYSFQGITEKNNQRRILKKAILENEEKIGNYSIGQWLAKYDQKQDPDMRDDQDILKFLNTEPEFSQLNKQEQIVLKKIIHIYDNLLASELIDIFESAVMLRDLENRPDEFINLSGDNLSVYNPVQNETFINKRVPQEFIKLTINEALKQHPEIGDQIIGNKKIKIKKLPNPVLPTVGNWISDYNFNYGFNQHDSVVRGNFIFKNQNTKLLDHEDRQRLSYLLKAYDENLPVKINLTTKEMIFPVPNLPSAPAKTSYQPESRTDNNNPFIKTDAGFTRPPVNQPSSPQPEKTFKTSEKKPAAEISASKNSVSKWKNLFKKPEKKMEASSKTDWPPTPAQKPQPPKSTPIYTHNILLSANSNEKPRSNIIFGKDKPINQKPDSKSSQPANKHIQTGNNQPNQNKVFFSSPQKLNRDNSKYAPNRIIPFSQINHPTKNNSETDSKKLRNNIVNLKDL